MDTPSTTRSTSAPPLCVDLDGTLMRSDVLYESLLLLIKHHPLEALRVPLWLLKGKAHLKRQLAERVTLRVETLPYHPELLTYLKAEREAGRKLVLATASDQAIALRIAEHTGLFDEVLASDGELNLLGEKKREALLRRFGSRGFDYAGNSRADVPIWQECREAIVVSNSGSLKEAARAGAQESRCFSAGPSLTRVMPRALRVHQWVKNLLLFVPLATAHQITNPRLMLAAVLGFLAFSFAASAGYILNDLLDLESDRTHRTKRDRPLASGALPIPVGLALVVLLLAGSGAIACTLPPLFALLVAGYFALSLAYSLRLKRMLLVDVFILAFLYTVRIIGGHLATHIHFSYWLLAFSMFGFLSLALLKRVSELHNLKEQEKVSAHGRAYQVRDLEQVATFGTTSGYMSGLVMALYLNSPEVTVLYKHPQVLWLVCPIILFGLSRMWITAHRGQMHEDPIVFALKDRMSLALGVVIAGLMAAAAW